MLVYQDLLSGDELLSDSFPYTETSNGILWEVQGQWIVKEAIDVDIGANPSSKGGKHESVHDQAIRVLDIVDTFRLQERPSYDKEMFAAYLKRYIANLTPLVSEDRQDEFNKNVEPAMKWLLSKAGELRLFVGESMKDGTCPVFAYYKEGKSEPTFIYFRDALKQLKC